MIELRTIYPANEATLRFLYDLLAEREDSINISHKKMPSWDDHINFVCSMPYRYWWLIIPSEAVIDERHAAYSAGAAYLSKQNEIGIFVKKEHQGKGYGKEAIKEIISRFPGERLLANISPKNERSQALFSGLGFKPIQHTFELAAAQIIKLGSMG